MVDHEWAVHDAANPRYADSISHHDHVAGRHHRIVVGPQKRAGCQINSHDCAGSGWTDQHALGKGRRQASHAARLIIVIINSDFLIKFGEWLRPDWGTTFDIEDIESHLTEFLDQDEETIVDGERCPERPCG